MRPGHLRPHVEAAGGKAVREKRRLHSGLVYLGHRVRRVGMFGGEFLGRRSCLIQLRWRGVSLWSFLLIKGWVLCCLDKKAGAFLVMGVIRVRLA